MWIQVAVCGPGHCTPDEEANAYRIGQLLAGRGAIVLCGGGTGVMAAAARGVRSRNGLVIGVRSDDDRSAASPDLSAVLMTNLGQARNAIIAWSADAMIMVGGSWGTLSEAALAMRRGGVPVVCLDGWRITDAAGNPVPGIEYVTSAQEAVARALAAVERRPTCDSP